ncbi:MAG TPA: 6-bladed beta-propeller [Stellaceae bacterium]|nr:6-bladed beta-propeller [Stellaceae bacterium]
MTQLGSGNYTYEPVRDFCKLPAGQSFGLVSRVAADAQDRIYVFQRKDPPVVVFDRDGKYLGAWGSGEVTDPHGLKIVGDTVYTTDRSDSVAKSFTLEGKPLLQFGTPGVHSDTGCEGSPWLALRAAGPFNHPTEMIAHPNGDIYVTDGYRNSRVHRFARDGRLVASWGTPGKGPGQFHLPHSIAIDDKGRLYVADRSNKRIQIFTPEGEFLTEWTGMGGPNDITRGTDGNFYIAEQEDAGNPAYVTVRDGEGRVLAKLESRHVHGVGVDSKGDIYAGLTQDRSVDKFVRVG